MSIVEIYRGFARTKCIEPVKRNKNGLRWISHRFEIKGGITWRDAMLADMCAPNPLLVLPRRRGPYRKHSDARPQ